MTMTSIFLAAAMLLSTPSTSASKLPSSASSASQLRGRSRSLAAQAPESVSGAVVVIDSRCPLRTPMRNDACTSLGNVCGYGHSFGGCSWDELQCLPTTVCLCVDALDGSGNGSWMCSPSALPTCPQDDTIENLPPVVASVSALAPDEPVVALASARSAAVSLASTTEDATGDSSSLAVVANATEAELVKPPPRLVVPRGKCDPDQPLPEPAADGTCPLVAPESFASSCAGYPVGAECKYGHMFFGCSWRELGCSPTAVCDCTAEGTWVCAMAGMARCGTFNETLGEWVEDTPEGLPWGDACDPEEPLPTKECPTEPQPEELALSTSCVDYPLDHRCEYNHVYTGCSWKELQCSPTLLGSCSANETWAWALMDPILCGDDLPDDLPRGECRPDEPLPIKECPLQPPRTNCTDYPANQECSYSHVYSGCSWDDLKCVPTQWCTCSEEDSWICSRPRQLRIDVSCQTFDERLQEWVDDALPEGLPKGQACNPDEPLPKRPVESNTEKNSVDGRLSVCPEEPEYNAPCDDYEPGLACGYRGMYTGCTWEELECTAIETCTCDEFGDGTWACMIFRKLAMMGCSEKPPGHPFGTYCDPNLPLPSPPLSQPEAIAELAEGAMP